MALIAMYLLFLVTIPLVSALDIVCDRSSMNTTCSNDIIRCRHSEVCRVICEDEGSCSNATIFANDSSSSLYLSCMDINACSGITVYCSSSPSLQKQCLIDFSNNDIENMRLFAANGWADVTITNYDSSKNTVSGSMHCLSGYASVCSFDLSQSPECIHPNHPCNAPEPTQ